MSDFVLKDICKDYMCDGIKQQVLNNVNLTIKEGESIAIVGQSGSGKTTLLNILGLLDSPSSGSYMYGDENLFEIKENKKAEYRNNLIGFVFQNFALIDDLNVLDNVKLTLKISNAKDKLKRKQINDMSVEALERVGLKTHINKYPSQLSGGQKQRVAIARALVNSPKIILADEPTGALDSKTADEIVNLLIDIKKQGKTLIIVTHNNNVAKKCDRIIEIKDGKIQED